MLEPVRIARANIIAAIQREMETLKARIGVVPSEINVQMSDISSLHTEHPKEFVLTDVRFTFRL